MKLAKWIGTLVVLASVTTSTSAASPDTDLGFKAAFPRPLTEKSYFGVAAIGATIVAAGVATYLTGGSGAPAAATGVSTVASWIAGGGAGSYMAGLSTVGGWFGGNAMLGAAILNGISLGTVGSWGPWAKLSATEKVLTLADLSATALDGVTRLRSTDTGQLEWQVRLPVPRGLADARLGDVLDTLDESVREQLKALDSLQAAKLRAEEANAQRKDLRDYLKKLEKAKKDSPKDRTIAAKYEEIVELVEEMKTLTDFAASELKSSQGSLDAALRASKVAEKSVLDEISRTKKSGGTNRNTVVLAVMAHNLGKPGDFRALLARVNTDALKDRSYFDYLQAVAALQTGNTRNAENLLSASWKSAPYAIEPPTLMVGILGSEGYVAHEVEIDTIAQRADKDFDADKYRPAATRVSLHYRIGTMALSAKQCGRALNEFKKAQSALSKLQKYFTDGGKDIRNLLEIGEANALYCQGSRPDAYIVFGKVLKRTAGDDARLLLCTQFSGGCGS